MEEVGEPYVNVTQLIEAVLHDQLMEDHTRYVRYNMRYMLNTIKNVYHWIITEEKCISFFRFDNNTPTSSSLELKTLFNQVMQSASNSTSKTTQVSNTAESKHDKKETDNESDDISK